MDKPISVGDLVMVVRPACCQNEFQGTPFTVTKIERMWRTCLGCGAEFDELFARSNLDRRPFFAMLSVLKRIDPPAIRDSEKRDEKLTEPA